MERAGCDNPGAIVFRNNNEIWRFIFFSFSFFLCMYAVTKELYSALKGVFANVFYTEWRLNSRRIKMNDDLNGRTIVLT